MGVQVQIPDMLWHSARHSSSGLWFTWPGMALLGSASPDSDSAQPAAGQPNHAEKLAMSSQGLEWEPNQLPKSCLGPADGSDLRVLSYYLDLQMDEGTGLSSGVVQCRRWLLPTAQLGVAIVAWDLLDVCHSPVWFGSAFGSLKRRLQLQDINYSPFGRWFRRKGVCGVSACDCRPGAGGQRGLTRSQAQDDCQSSIS